MLNSKLVYYSVLADQPLPPVPSREMVLGVNMHFRGGLIVQSPIYGRMPWWPSALSWCDSVTRTNSYILAHEVGDTHVIIEVPNGKPLYDEWGQFYSPDKFGPLDWTNGEQGPLDPKFISLVREAINHGFRYIIAMDEQMDNSLRIIPLVTQALKAAKLDQYGFVIPGYDGVFYGWPAEAIMEWGAKARSINPNCYLGMEHNVGHIPLGEGGSDYQLNGRMKDFDVILGEFGPNIHQDSTWQILGRMIRPYHRPFDQPGGDDPNPPFYLVDSSRGHREYCAFETDNPYEWVRIDVNNPNAVAQKQDELAAEFRYFKSMGCRWVG